MHNHYTYLDQHLLTFLANIGLEEGHMHTGLIASHADKASVFQDDWEAGGVPFEHGVAIFLLWWSRRYRSEVPNHMDLQQWVVENYKTGHRFFEALPPVKAR